MNFLTIVGIVIFSYLIGSIPWGYVLVKIFTGKDVRSVESGRTGGTNAMRASNFWIGFFTSLLDILKSASTVWAAKALVPNQPWLHIIAPVFAIIGHNYSIYLIERDANGKLKIHGGAGGAPATGGAIGLWWPNALILIPLGFLIVFGIGYASVATMSLPVMAGIVFAFRAIRFGAPWEYIAFGLFAEVLIIWALRPNIRRLLRGEERVVGWRPKKVNSNDHDTPPEAG